MWYPLVLCTICVLTVLTDAVRMDLRGEPRSPRAGLSRRASISGTSLLDDTSNVDYYINATLGGEQFPLLIDTGSSDLWVAAQVPGAKATGKNTTITYASGSASGLIKTAPLDFAGYNIPAQAYVEVSPSDQNPAGKGLIGLGPSSNSLIVFTLSNSAADPPLDRIFRQNMSTPNYLTILLGRSQDPTDLFPGELTVGEVIPGYENVTQQSKIPVTTSSSSHWQILLDDNGIIGPNGTVIPITTAVSGTKNHNQATVVLDTGFTLPQLSKSISDAIYSGVPGAQFRNLSGIGPIWTLPCNQEVNLTFKFAGVNFPVHPLDTSIPNNGMSSDLTDPSICLGAFQPVSFFSFPTTFDIILGMAFLRNAYTLINFGDFVDGTSNKAPPYVQLLSTTNNTAEAHSDFVQVRLNGVDTTVDRTLMGNNNTNTPSSPSHKATSVVKWIVIAVVAGLAVLLLLLGLCFCCVKRGFSKRKSDPILNGSYRLLDAPAPPPVEMHAAPPVYQPEYYRSPWDHRP